MYEQNENINNETENLKRNTKILKLKNGTTEIKISLEEFNGESERAGEIISEPEDRAMKRIKSEKEKEKYWREENRT